MAENERALSMAYVPRSEGCVVSNQHQNDADGDDDKPCRDPQPDCKSQPVVFPHAALPLRPGFSRGAPIRSDATVFDATIIQYAVEGEARKDFVSKALTEELGR
jgi:hypothetical protein